MAAQAAREQTQAFAASLAQARSSHGNDVKSLQSRAKQMIELTRKKIQSAAYAAGGRNYAKLFYTVDKDHSDGIDAIEFLGLVRRVLRINPQDLPDAQASAAFKIIDTDGNGTISLEELIAFASSGDGWRGYEEDEDDYVPPQPTPGHATPERKRKSKHVSKMAAKEIEKIRHRLAAAAYSEGGLDFETLYAKVDKDHSGAIDSEEFSSFVRRVLRVPPRELQDAQVYLAFVHIDKNRDGSVSLEEFIEFAKGGAGWKGYDERPIGDGDEITVTEVPKEMSSSAEHRSQSSQPQELGAQSRSSRDSAPGESEWRVNDRVTVKLKTGIVVSGALKFLGNTSFKEGDWAGIELDKEFTAHAKNDGSIEGIRYFDGTRGMFVGLEYLRRESSMTGPENGAGESQSMDLRGVLGPTKAKPAATLGSPSRREESAQFAGGPLLSPFRTAAGLNMSSISPASSWRPQMETPAKSQPRRGGHNMDTDGVLDVDTEFDTAEERPRTGLPASVNVISDSSSNLISMVEMLAESDHLRKAVQAEVKQQVEAALATSTMEKRMQKMMLALKSIQQDIRRACDKLSASKDVASSFDTLVHLHLKAQEAVQELEAEREARSQETAVLNAEIKRLEREVGDRDAGWTPNGKSKRGMRTGIRGAASPTGKQRPSSSSFGSGSRFR